ncbi:protein required for normal CLN1 and CLN2 G1 cyclin expression [Polyrhizophydium stewartii]|uniref:Protein required for normal CLN1 and CLN2 G1 cyclin expression n=1 Tax=Polyrhizophydium stewartii TaxID=2732419 RepID=A0ABR4N7D2_9FUNG
MDTTFEIPLHRQGNQEVLVVNTATLEDPTSWEALLNVLISEGIQLSYFLEFAVKSALQYYRLGRMETFDRFLEAALETSATRSGEDVIVIQILNAMAARSIELAEANAAEFDTHTANATSLLNRAESMDRMNLLTIVGKANLMLVRKQLYQAMYSFRGALQQDANYLPALLGLATVEFQKGDYKAALMHYQRVLVLVPDIQPDVRVPIGLTFYHLGMEAEARAAFSRALELNPENVDALALISVMETNKARNPSTPDKDRGEASKKANSLIYGAYSLHRKHAVIFNQMAERFFLKGSDNNEKARIMAEAALRSATNKVSRGDSLAIKAKIAQSNKRYEEAHTLFAEAHQLNPDSIAIQLGLAQSLIFKKKYTEAVTHLESILSKEPNNYETLMIAAAVYAQVPEMANKAADAYERLKKLLRASQSDGIQSKTTPGDDSSLNDPELLIDIARFYEKTDIKQAQSALERAISIFETTPNVAVPPELYNNLAVLYHLEALKPQSSKDAAQQSMNAAERLYQRAMEAGYEGVEAVRRIEDVRTTIKYNLARLSESRGSAKGAESQYLDILKVHPSYVDAILRLGCIALEQGKIENALQHFADALAIDDRNVRAWSLVAKAHITNKMARLARKAFEKILQEIDKYDTYALCHTGNICLRFARSDPKQCDIHCKRAVEFFTKALRQDTRNVYAATGIAIAFAQLDKLEEARSLFTQIQEAASSNTNVTVNLAHVLVEIGQPHAAIPLVASTQLIYESVVKRGSATDLDVIRSLARAHYIVAKTEKLPDVMHTVAKRLEEAVALSPNDLSLKYNLALAKQQYAQLLNDQPKEKRPLAALREAVIGLETSEKIFDELSKRRADASLGYDVERARERANYSKGVRRVTEKKIHETEVLDRQREDRLADIRAKRDELAEQKRREEEHRRLEEQRQQEELAEMRRRIKEQVQLENEKMRIALQEEKERAERRKSSNRGGGGGGGEDDDEDEDDDARRGDSDGEPRRSSKPKQKRKRKEKPARAEGPSSDEDDEEMRIKRAKSSGIRSKLSAAVIDSDED